MTGDQKERPRARGLTALAALAAAMVACWAAAAPAAPVDEAAVNAPVNAPINAPANAVESVNAAAPATEATAVAPPPAESPPAAEHPAAPAVDLAADEAATAQLANRAGLVSNDARLETLAESAAHLEAEARAAAAVSAAEIRQINTELGKIAPSGRRKPTASQQARQAPLIAQRAALQGQLAEAERVAAEAQGAYNLIAERRREGFSARVLTRSPSPLSPTFWSSLASEADADLGRLQSMASDAVQTVAAAPEPRAAVALAFALAIAAALLFPVRRVLAGLGRRKAGRERHAGLARTGAALWIAVVDIAAPTLAVVLVRLVAEWAGLLSPQADALAGAAVTATAWAAGVLALGNVLAAESDADRRLLELSDDEAARVRAPLIIVAIVTAAGFLLTRLIYVIGASVAATIAANCVLSLAYAGAAALFLASFGRARAPAPDAAAADARRDSVWTLISLALTAAIVVTLGAIVAGFTTLAALTSGQIFWLGLVGAASYLIMRFADDLTASIFRPRGWAARTLYALFHFRRSTIAQIGALVSAGLQVLVLAGAVTLALTPFGQGGELLLTHLTELGRPIRIGSATISPGAVAAGIVTFMIGMALVRAVQRWIERRYLPVTDWDAGVRNSVTTGVGYLGVAIAVACALAASGLGFTQIALIASALSVGIGFGLQTIVQNFVSGVILLVERPVKVGDWVSIGGVEGDIRRIRVRATDIETADHTMVIVPNSDLVTKQVANKTLGERFARVDLRLSVSAAADVERARELVLGVVGCRRPAAAPNPEIFVDSLAANGAVNLTCHFYVEEPRQVLAARSDSYLEILRVLQEHKIAFAGPA